MACRKKLIEVALPLEAINVASACEKSIRHGHPSMLHQVEGSAGIAEDVRYYGQWMRDEAYKQIGHLYPKVQLPKENERCGARKFACRMALTLPSQDQAMCQVIAEYLGLVNRFVRRTSSFRHLSAWN